MPQAPAQVDALQVEPGAVGTRLIDRDTTTGDLRFTDVSQPGGVLLSDLAGLRSIASVLTVGLAGAGVQFTAIQAALDAVLASSSLASPTLILVAPGTYTENLSIENDGVFLIGMGGVTITALSADATIRIQAGVSTTPLTCHLENLRITNSGAGEECVLITGGASSTLGSQGIRLLDCDLVASGVGTFQIKATEANHIRVVGGSWGGGTSTSVSFADQCASFTLRGVGEVGALQLSYDSGGVIPLVLTSQYAIEDCGVVGNILTSLTGVGSLLLSNCPSVGNLTQGGDRPSEITASRLKSLILNGSTSATLLGSSYTSFAGAGVLKVWDGEKFILPGFVLLREQFRPGSVLPTANADWAVPVTAAVGSDPVTASLPVLAFDDTVGEGVGFLLTVPSNATQVTFSFKGRAAVAPAGSSAVGLDLYVRAIPNNTPIPAWAPSVPLVPVSVPTNVTYQYDSETLTLSAAGLSAGNLHLFEVARNTSVAGNLVGDWLLVELGVEFT